MEAHTSFSSSSEVPPSSRPQISFIAQQPVSFMCISPSTHSDSGPLRLHIPRRTLSRADAEWTHLHLVLRLRSLHESDSGRLTSAVVVNCPHPHLQHIPRVGVDVAAL